MKLEDNPFAHVTDPEKLSADLREEYYRFWASRTPNERLAEAYRLNRCKWGDEVFERGIDKSKIEVEDITTGIVTVIQNPNPKQK
jgi:hypothetical protein